MFKHLNLHSPSFPPLLGQAPGRASLGRPLPIKNRQSFNPAAPGHCDQARTAFRFRPSPAGAPAIRLAVKTPL